MTVTLSETERATSWSKDPASQAYWLLRIVFTVAPILFGLDKFLNVLTDWSAYIAPIVNEALLINADQFLYFVGALEIAASLTVLIAPRYGSLIVAVWLTGVIVNLLFSGHNFDIALRDFGLLVGALALFRLSSMPGVHHRGDE
ncbi:MAG TPA: hypothetical protein PK781_04350 [Terrimesophilobacter sp.]|nr:hypothetical protein [Terrimesophilobacter sp.]HRP99674.1 hypothetical protein [Terrimesophilobacter sp.]